MYSKIEAATSSLGIMVLPEFIEWASGDKLIYQ